MPINLSASSSQLSVGRAAGSRLFLGGLSTLILHFVAVEAHSRIVLAAMTITP
jgi:hypothetical protein